MHAAHRMTEWLWPRYVELIVKLHDSDRRLRLYHDRVRVHPHRTLREDRRFTGAGDTTPHRGRRSTREPRID